MKKRLLFLTALIPLFFLSCNKKEPVIDFVDFENLTLGASGYWNGSDGSGGFMAGNIIFVNHFDEGEQEWSGFAYTNHTDTVTKDATNMFSSISAGGKGGSEKYGIFHFSGVPDTLFFEIPEKITDIAFANTSYSYNIMKYGDLFHDKFGGESGISPDWFKLTITAINETGQAVGIVDLYLADFRNQDNSKDYIANAWTSIDLSSFGFVSALKFEMFSTDSGDLGINTPAYVCIDNIKGELDITPE